MSMWSPFDDEEDRKEYNRLHPMLAPKPLSEQEREAVEKSLKERIRTQEGPINAEVARRLRQLARRNRRA